MTERAAARAVVPDWDMTTWFPALGGEGYRAFRAALDDDLAALSREAPALGGLGETGVEAWARLVQRLEDVSARATHLGAYLHCLGAADARNEAVRTEIAALSVSRAELEKIYVAVRAAVRDAGDADFERLRAHPALADAGYFLARLRRRAAWSMDTELERLAADLDTTGLSAWSRLYDQISGTLEFDLEVPGASAKRVPVSMTRSLLEDPDPATRRAALSGANAAWQASGEAVAACLNAISGTRILLYRRRGVPHFLDPALFDAGITRRTLEALLAAARDRRELPRAYLRRKARLLGRDRLGVQDLSAPLLASGAAPPRVSYEDARARVLGAFERFHPALAGFARHAFDARWIDWSPRTGKRPGGFCASSPVVRESRIFTTFDGTLGDVAVIAHELGHAFHAHVMRDLRPFALRYPMTLAETASTFAEQILIDAVLASDETTAAERTLLLDRRLQDAATFLLNIPMRFEFERALYEERAAGELRVSRLCELVLAAQREQYGDALAEDELDAWFWASKLHFYIAGLSFYNFPYTFGYLFSLGLYARAREEGAAFLPRYEALLRATGSDTAEAVARTALGVDLEDEAFWHASIDLLEDDLRAFEETTGVS